MEADRAWHWFHALQGVSLQEKEALLSRLHSPMEIYRESEKAWNLMEFQDDKVKARIIEAVLSKEQRERSKKSYESLLENNIRLISRDSAEYPKKLREIFRPPFVLYLYGSLPKPELPALAVIGARQCSVYGEEIAAQLSKACAAAGIQIISGMARGIDASAQRAAISEEGGAYAVLGSGVDVCYPREQKGLYELLKRQGGVLSEEVPGTPPLSFHFPKRNRIISGLSDAILVVEARKKSGSLITVEYALEQGKDIFAVPGRIYDTLSEGTNQLIKEGAYPVCEPEDILQIMLRKMPVSFCQNKKNQNFVLETKEKIVYANLSLQPKHIHQLSEETDIPLPELSCLLLEMEMKQYIKQTTKNFYIYRL